MKKMPRVRWLTVILLLLPTIWLGTKLADFLSNPRQIAFDNPQLLLANIPFAVGPRALKWSPEGKYIAMGGSIGSLKAPRQIIQGIAIASVDSPRIVAQIKTTNFFAEKFEWSSDGRLWVLAGDGWDVYAAPFAKKEHISAGLPKQYITKRGFIFDPNNQLIVVIPDRSGDLPQSEDEKYTIQLWKQGRRLHKIRLVPHQAGILRVLDSLALSPDKKYLALTVAGGIGVDADGTGELWLLDTQTGKLQFLHEGKTGFGIADYPVQSVKPLWGKESKTIVFGDDEFGVEEINIFNKKRTLILKSGWAGHDIKLSHDGKWIGFIRETRNGADVVSAPTVASQDGKLWSRIPIKYAPWTMDVWDWHPRENTIAWAAPKNFNGPCPLYIWRIDK